MSLLLPLTKNNFCNRSVFVIVLFLIVQFFANDFTEDRWRKAALKNAFVLLGKQRFEHAAAFFLLGGALKDALEVNHLFQNFIINFQCIRDCKLSDIVYVYLVKITW